MSLRGSPPVISVGHRGPLEASHQCEMGNYRLTLAFPPYVISPQNFKRSSSRYLGSMQAEARLIGRREFEFQSKIASSILIHDNFEWLKVDLEDWLNSDCFPPLSSGQKTPTMAFGLPKHSQPNNSDPIEKIHLFNLPPIAAV